MFFQPISSSHKPNWDLWSKPEHSSCVKAVCANNSGLLHKKGSGHKSQARALKHTNDRGNNINISNRRQQYEEATKRWRTHSVRERHKYPVRENETRLTKTGSEGIQTTSNKNNTFGSWAWPVYLLKLQDHHQTGRWPQHLAASVAANLASRNQSFYDITKGWFYKVAVHLHTHTHTTVEGLFARYETFWLKLCTHRCACRLYKQQRSECNRSTALRWECPAVDIATSQQIRSVLFVNMSL